MEPPPPPSPPGVVINNIIGQPPVTGTTSSPACDQAYRPPAQLAADVVVRLELKSDSNDCWTAQVARFPAGETLKYIITYFNTSDAEQRQVVVRASLPPNVDVIPDTTRIFNVSHPDGAPYDSDNISGGGIIIGNYGPGTNAYVTFEAALPFEGELSCGRHDLRTVGVVRPEGLSEYYNTTSILTFRDC